MTSGDAGRDRQPGAASLVRGGEGPGQAGRAVEEPGAGGGVGVETPVTRQMDHALSHLTGFAGWLASQPTLIQVAIGIGIVAALYAVLVVLRLIAVALYAAFRGLG